MDIATILGVVSAFGLVFGTIAFGGGAGAFIDVGSLAIVVGGTLGAALINYPLRDFLSTAKVLKNAFIYKLTPPQETIRQMVEYSARARKEGILALESALSDDTDEFLAKGVRLAVDGQEAKAIENILTNEVDYLEQRHEKGAEVFSSMGAFAPALGLIGTLIGLVKMLQSMDDPSSIGPSMALALITTFYGAILANLVFNPIAGKLRTRSKEEVLLRELQLQGILAITSGDNPRIVEQKLNAFLAPKQRKSQFEGKEAA
ncbi:MAG: motility protein A [Deltaproteobacteria bacterium]|nr:motility protein A [Deltaproteobacteria bacterium]